VRDYRYKQNSCTRETSIPGPTVRPSRVRSDNQPSVPHPRVHSPIRWADWLSRLRPWGGQTRLTGCHGDLMDWSEQISSPKTPERIAGFQRIALASARWVSFRFFFLHSFLLPSFKLLLYDGSCSLRKKWEDLGSIHLKLLCSLRLLVSLAKATHCFYFVCLLNGENIKSVKYNLNFILNNKNLIINNKNLIIKYFYFFVSFWNQS